MICRVIFLSPCEYLVPQQSFYSMVLVSVDNLPEFMITLVSQNGQ